MSLQADRNAWAATAQPWEFDWWKKNRATEDNHPLGRVISQLLCARIGLTGDVVAGKSLLDVGCGPTGRLRGLDEFKGPAEWWAMDPLLERYKTLAWPNFNVYDRFRNEAAEELQPDFVGKFDVVVSLNALDHGYDLPLALANLRSYLKVGGQALISFDCTDDPTPDPTHPLRIPKEKADRAFVAAGFTIVGCSRQPCFPNVDADGVPRSWRNNWGHGTHWHWTLR